MGPHHDDDSAARDPDNNDPDHSAPRMYSPIKMTTTMPPPRHARDPDHDEDTSGDGDDNDNDGAGHKSRLPM